MLLSKTSLPTVFEITDVSIPNYITKQFLESLEYGVHFRHENNVRESAAISEELEKFISSTLEELNLKFREKLLELSNSDFHHWWPTEVYECYNFGHTSDLVSAGIFKDSPRFNMGMHIDNGLSLGTSIINLIDQDANTVYYGDNTEDNIIYSGPIKKGTGIIHLNHPELWHSGINNTDQERFILMTYYAVNNNICGQNR